MRNGEWSMENQESRIESRWSLPALPGHDQYDDDAGGHRI